MAPAPTYPAPHRQLGSLMVEARRRGLTFEQWWHEALQIDRPLVLTTTPDPPRGAVRWPSDRNDRVSWRAAIEDSVDGWRRAYERVEPTGPERAVLFLGEELGWLRAERPPTSHGIAA